MSMTGASCRPAIKVCASCHPRDAWELSWTRSAHQSGTGTHTPVCSTHFKRWGKPELLTRGREETASLARGAIQ